MTLERFVAEAAGCLKPSADSLTEAMDFLDDDYDEGIVEDTTAARLHDDDSVDTAAVKPKKVNAFRKRQREELTYLRSKVREMETDLEGLQDKHAKFASDLTPWKILATQLRAEKDRAVQDNAAWRAALQDQIEFGNALHAILKKRPRLSMIPTLGDAQWKMLNLPASPVARRDTAAAIVDQQYRLLPSVLVSTGLMQQTTNVTSCIPKSWHDDLLVVEAAACRYYEGSDFQLWAQIFWMVLTGELHLAVASPTLVLICDTEPKKIVVEPVDDLGGCSVKYFNKCTPPTLQPGVTSPDVAVVEKVIDGLIRHSSHILRHFEDVMNGLIPPSEG
ncbi:hypothetical protein DYB36_011942 [Aphanomyces astaci]|uniref:Uncharacterized protein n=3 Tax=Aphanomyces astaci TaxID=112090 RepID=A0A397BQA5_APHAT|nr:hypothetical protein DYB36_011942 [Aphanomyces astaci]